MTEQRRLTIRAELARRMGWIPEDAVATEQWEIGSLDFTMKPSWRSPSGLRGFKFPPDPFTNAEDNRALVEWLVAFEGDSKWLIFTQSAAVAATTKNLGCEFARSVEGEMDIESLKMVVAFIAIILIAIMWKNVADGNRRGR